MSLIDQLKTQLISGPTFVIGVESQHTSSSIGKIISNNQNVEINIFIDTIIDSDHLKLCYRLTNVDFKLLKVKSMGTVYQEDGIIRIERMELRYSDTYEQYVLNIETNRFFNRGRILISFSNIADAHNIYDYRPINLLPIQGSGSGCRPGIKGSLEQTANPFK